MKSNHSSLVFMFPGQGLLYAGICFDLYQNIPSFKSHFDTCSSILNQEFQVCILSLVSIDQGPLPKNLIFQSCAAFSMEYALAMTLIESGINPSAMIGYSIGEYVAACVSGTLCLRDALYLNVVRSELMQKTPNGKMVTVPLSVEETVPLIGESLEIAVDLGKSCIVSGAIDEVNSIESILKSKKIFTFPLDIDCAGHSKLLEPVIPEFLFKTSRVTFFEPKIPFISNITGQFISASKAMDISYWAKQMRHRVQLSKGLDTVLAIDSPVFIEVGPGNSLSMMIKQLESPDQDNRVITLVQKRGGVLSGHQYLNNKISELKEAVHVYS